VSINCIRRTLEKAAETHPAKVAILHNDTRFDEQLTYAELLTRVNQVALYLQELDASGSTPTRACRRWWQFSPSSRPTTSSCR